MRYMTAILWCNGEIPSDDLIKRVLTEGKEVFGVDGGAEIAISVGIKVQKVLGDFDSINIDKWRGESEYLPDQKNIIHLKVASKRKSFLAISNKSEFEVPDDFFDFKD